MESGSTKNVLNVVLARIRSFSSEYLNYRNDKGMKNGIDVLIK